MIRKLLGQERTSNLTGFRLRSSEPSRVEGLSDAVFGFALTLLVVSLEVPQTFDGLLVSIRGFGAFALSFGLLVVIWHEHYTFFKRYGLHDTFVIMWNTVLLFLIVFYVYPLKFLFTLFFNEVFGLSFMVTLPGGAEVPMIREGQLDHLYIIFGIGWTSVWIVFVLLYRHVLQKSDQLDLNSLERFETRASIVENLSAAVIGLVSIVLAILGTGSVAGWVYLVMFPLTWAIKRRNALNRPIIDTDQAGVSPESTD